MEKMIVCASCGAEYDSELVRCPYCGTAYAPAEEKEYMQQLDETRKELEAHKEDGIKSMKKGLGRVILLTVLAVAVIVLLIIGGLWFSKSGESDRDAKKKEEFLNHLGVTTQAEEGPER